MSFDNNKQVIVSVVHSKKENAPVMRVNLEITETLPPGKYEAGLWAWERKDGTFVTDDQGKKKLKGKLTEDTYQPAQNTSPPAPEPQQDFKDSDIPFSGEAA